MEKRKRRRRKDNKKRLILVVDGILLLALVAAAVVLAVNLTKKGGKQEAARPAEPAQASPAADGVLPGADNPAPAAPAASKDPAQAYAALQAEGVDVLAWLSCDGTAIQYPVVQNMDEEYYMTRDVYGKKDQNGAISLDGRNSPELTDGQILLYGNAMADGSMFGSLVSYQDQAYYEQHPTMTLYTPAASYKVRIFAAHLASPQMSNYPTWFENKEARVAYIQEVCAKSFLNADITIPEDAKLLSLVTNSAFDAGENARFVVHGILEQN